MPSEAALVCILSEFCRYLSCFSCCQGIVIPCMIEYCLTGMWLGCLAEFCLCNSPCQLDCISRMDAEEDNQYFRYFDSTVNPPESVMLLLCSKGSFHCCGAYTGKFFLDHADRGCRFSFLAFL